MSCMLDSVTGLTRREASGSICKALLKYMVIFQAGSVTSKQVWQGQNTVQSVEQAGQRSAYQNPEG